MMNYLKITAKYLHNLSKMLPLGIYAAIVLILPFKSLHSAESNLAMINTNHYKTAIYERVNALNPDKYLDSLKNFNMFTRNIQKGKLKLSFEFGYDPYASSGKFNPDKNGYIYIKDFSDNYAQLKKLQKIEYRFSDSSLLRMNISKNYISVSSSEETHSVNKKSFDAKLSLFGGVDDSLNFFINASKLRHYLQERGYGNFEKTFKNASFLTGYEKNFARGLNVNLNFGTSFASLPDSSIKKHALNYGLSIVKLFNFSKLTLNFNHGLVNESNVAGFYEACLRDKASAVYECMLLKNMYFSVKCGFMRANGIDSANINDKSRNMLLASTGLKFKIADCAQGEIKYSFLSDSENPLAKTANSASINFSYSFF